MPRRYLLLSLLLFVCLSLVGCGDGGDFVASTGAVGGSDGGIGVGDAAADNNSDAIAESIRQINAQVVLPAGMTFE